MPVDDLSDSPYAAPSADSVPAEVVVTNVRYRVLGMLTLAAAISYLSRNAVSVAESTIRTDLGLSLKQSGWFMGVFFWSYAVLQVPAGWLAHRHGSRLALSLFLMAGAVSAIGIGLAPGLWLLLVAQLVMGAAQAGIFPASCHTISLWIPPARRTLACGILATGMQVGAILAGLLTGVLLRTTNWRIVFLIYGIPGIWWAIHFFGRFRETPQSDGRVSDQELRFIGTTSRQVDAGTQRKPTPWTAILLNSSIWFLCGQQICRAAGYMFFASWFPTFLQETRGLSVRESGYLQALVFAGTLTGSLCGGLLTDWVWQRTGSLRLSRSGVGAVFLSACAALILTAWSVDQVLPAVLLLALGAVFAALAGPCAFSATIDIGGDHVPQVFGLMNMMGNLAAAACPILVAELFEHTADWNLVLLLFAGMYFSGAVCWAFVDPGRTTAS
ncbi:MAG: MFS transporter [Planctomycetaceae bacterium]|nr:MFS transporter [Planctomycetaceae bacterium]